jgi:hypothetical protein
VEISETMGSDWPQLSDKMMYIHIQGASGAIVNTLGGGSMEYSE